jgi:hypothetical protein
MLEGLFRRTPHEDSIPVLTEIIVTTPHAVPAAQVDDLPPLSPLPGPIPTIAPPPQADVTSTAASVETESHKPDFGRTQGLSLLVSTDLAQFEARIRDAVLTRLHPRIDPVLSDRIDSAVCEVLAAEIPALRDKIAAALHETLKDTVSRAISKELAKLHAERQRAGENTEPRTEPR